MSESVESDTSPAPAVPAPVSPTLALPQLVATAGVFPQRGTEAPAPFYIGMIQTFAGTTHGAFGAPPAQGQIVAMASNMPLFALFGTAYGGDGKTSFALPDLRGRTPIGGYPGEEQAQTLSLRYVISEQAGPAPVGSVALFGGNMVPPGWLFCDGGSWSPDDYPQLYAAIEMTFGGDGGVFAVPNLDGRAVVGTGSGPGLPPVALGQRVAGPVPGLGLTPIICTQGVFPLATGGGAFPAHTPFVGQVLAFAGQQLPAGWLPAVGRLLPIGSYPPLFALLGTAYGGDGTTSFALPDLRGRMMTGT